MAEESTIASSGSRNGTPAASATTLYIAVSVTCLSSTSTRRGVFFSEAACSIACFAISSEIMLRSKSSCILWFIFSVCHFYLLNCEL